MVAWRGAANVPVSSFPSNVRSGQNFEMMDAFGLIDVTRPPYNARNDGTGDQAGAIRNAEGVRLRRTLGS